MQRPTNVARSELQDSSPNAVFTSLANRDRRRIIRVLDDRSPDAVSRETLVEVFADGADRDERAAEVALHHGHLPMLTEAGLVERTDDERLTLADHPALQDPGIEAILDGDVDATRESIDALFQALGDARRRRTLDVLSHVFGRVDVETLARQLETYDDDRDETAEMRRLRSDLYHAHLPHLDDAGLVEFDADDGTVRYDGHPQLRVPWTQSVFQAEFQRRLTGPGAAGDIGEIAGRENVVSFGQSLSERADDELFCMVTDTRLLEAGCLTRIRDAVQRGVTVYLGTRDVAVREYVREHAPEVVLWEPSTDWLDVPIAGDRVGRLLLADREAVLLGTLQETSDGTREEQAIVGEGEHNSLVTMICQLLGPHLEDVDPDAGDVEAQLPV